VIYAVYLEVDRLYGSPRSHMDTLALMASACAYMPCPGKAWVLH